jgi:hypothetical protein
MAFILAINTQIRRFRLSFSRQDLMQSVGCLRREYLNQYERRSCPAGLDFAPVAGCIGGNR